MTGLNEDEIWIVEQLGLCAVQFSRVVRLTELAIPSVVDNDINEFVALIHNAQARVMQQAAARAHPDTFRLLGEARPREAR